MRKTAEMRDHDRIVSMADQLTENVCRQRKIKCWKRAGAGIYDRTAEAQKIFDQIYNHINDVITTFLDRR